jgi:hypothetical protein
MGKDSFQEVDIFSMAKFFTKKCYLAQSADDLEGIIAESGKHPEFFLKKMRSQISSPKRLLTYLTKMCTFQISNLSH